MIALLAGALGLGALFIVIERRVPDPLVPFSIFKNRDMTAGNVVMLLVGGAMVALFFALSVFLQEVMHLDALAAGLTQPHIVALYDSGGIGELLYYVMPFIDGESLRDRLAREGKVPVADAMQIGREVAVRVRAFGCRLLYTDVTRAPEEVEAPLDARFLARGPS